MDHFHTFPIKTEGEYEEMRVVPVTPFALYSDGRLTVDCAMCYWEIYTGEVPCVS